MGENQTHIIGGGGDPAAVAKRCEDILEKVANEPSAHLKGVHRERYTRMQSVVAEIGIGGRMEVDMGEQRDQIIDSLNSAKNAVQHGMLPGGGVALYQASKILLNGIDGITDDSERMGVQVLM